MGEFIDLNNDPSIPRIKFETCEHRSKNPETRVTCCKDAPETGYICYQRGIFNVKPEICFTCPFYKKL